MVETRSGLATEQRRNSTSSFSSATLLISSILIATLAIGIGLSTFDSAVDKAHNVFTRGHYAFGGGAKSSYWESVPSWEELKAHAPSRDAYLPPQPSFYEKAKGYVLRKPVRQVQAEDAYARKKNEAVGAYNHAYDATANTAHDAKNAASDKVDGLTQRVKQFVLGAKTKSEQEAERLRRISADAQWRAEYQSKQTLWQKIEHVVLGSFRSPANDHYAAARGDASGAYEHTKNAAGETYDAARYAASGVLSGGKAAARAGQGAAAAAGDVGSRAASSASATAQQAYDASKGPANTAAGYVSDAYKSVSDAASRAGQYSKEQLKAIGDAARTAGIKAGLTKEEAEHRAQEAIQQAKHRTQETYHAATA